MSDNANWPNPEELAWIQQSPDPTAAQLRQRMAEAQMGVPHAMHMVATLLQELRAQAARARGEDVGFIDPLGDFDQVQGNPLEDRKLIVVYGDGETGKSTSVGRAFYRNNIPKPAHEGGGVYPLGTALVSSDDTVISPYADWFYRNPEEAASLGNMAPVPPSQGGIRRTNFPEKDTDGRTPFNVYNALYNYVRRITDAQARMGTDFPYAGVVFDEFGTLMDRSLANLMAIANDPDTTMFKSDKGKPNPGACYGAILELLRTVCSLARRRPDPRDPSGRATVPGLYTVLVCHPVSKGEKHDLGRAKMPSASAAQWLFNSSDIMVRCYKEKLRLAEDAGIPKLGQKADAPVISQEEVLRSQLLTPTEKWDDQFMVRRIQASSDDVWAAKVRGWDAPLRYPLDLLALLRERGLAL